MDTGWHGTHTAYLMVGRPDTAGNGGVAPGARLVSGTVMEGGAVVARVIAGLDWLVTERVKVGCLSAGVDPANPVLGAVVRSASLRGLLLVTPIGNGGAGAYVSPGGSGEVLSVGACHNDGTVARFSGSRNDPAGRCTAPQVVAPGVERRSAVPGGAYGRRSGTSAACASVAGLAALLLEAFPHARSHDIMAAIIDSCLPRAAAQHHRSMAGLVSPTKALKILQQRRSAPAAEPPTDTAATAGARVDARLRHTLDRTPDDDWCEAILVYSGRAALDAASARLAACERMQPFAHLPAVLARARPKTISHLLQAPGLVAAGAVDIDTSPSWLRTH